MVDLRAQYEKLKPEIDEAVSKVINSATFIKGREVLQFEDELREYLGARHVVSCANGTDALQIAMMALDLKPGDEVITTDFTFISTVEVVAFMGLKLVLVDPYDETYNISVEAIRNAITPKTKAIVPVHLFGQCANMEEIINIANENNLYVIEDAAQATGAEYRFSNGTINRAGTMGRIGTTSFFPSKNLGCYGDGGAIITWDHYLANQMRSIANHGMKVKYYHDDIGINSRLDTIQAAILSVKLRHLDNFNNARARVASYYDEALQSCRSVELPGRSSFSSHIFHQYTIRVKNGKRNELKEFLNANNVPSMIYYPVPMHLQKAYKYLGYKEGDLPVTEALSKEVLSLPICPELDDQQLSYITSCILNFFNGHDK